MKKLIPLTLTFACLLAVPPQSAQAQIGGGFYDCRMPEWELYSRCVLDRIVTASHPWNCTGWKEKVTQDYVAVCSLKPAFPPWGAVYCSGSLWNEQSRIRYFNCLRMEMDRGLACTMYTTWSGGLRAFCSRVLHRPGT